MIVMNLRFLTQFLSLFVIQLTLSADNAAKDYTWEYEVSDLEADPKVHYGKLSNGLRYAIMPNSEPPKNVSLRLRVNAGSLMEEDDQQGLAHFLEHMAFNGTKHFSEGEMVEYFQRIGMAFGADTNAHTSFNETVYKIELPDNVDGYLKDGMQVLRDYADGMLLKEDEIEKERGIILAEKRDRNNVMYRGFEAFVKFSFPKSLLSERLPIGLESVIKEAGRDRFERFYRNWYTADRMLLVVTGDVKVDEIEKLVQEYFGDMETPKVKRADPEVGGSLEKGLNVSVYVDSDAPTSEVIISAIKPTKKKVEMRADIIDEVHKLVAHAILSRRLDTIKTKPEASFTEASAFGYNYLKLFDLAGVELKCNPGMCNKTIETAEQELRRALEYGFTKDEVEEVGSIVLNQFEQEKKKAPTRKSKDLSDLLVQTLGKREVFTSPEYDFDIVKEAIETMTPTIVHKAFEDAWASEGRLLFVSGNVNPDFTKEDALKIYNESLAKSVEKPAEKEAIVFAYENFGNPGKVMVKKQDKDLGVNIYRFQNNVRLNFKQTDFDANEVSVKVRFGSGCLGAYGKAEGLPVLTKEVFLKGGLEAHSYDDINRYFSGKTVKIEFDVEQDAFVLKGTTSPQYLKEQLNLLAAFMKAPGFREEGLTQAHKVLEGTYEELRQDIEKLLFTQVLRYVANDDSRFGYPKKEQLFKLDMDDVRNWMREDLQKGYIEIAIVGDVKEADMFKAVAETFGAFDKRDEKKPFYLKERKLGFSKPGSKRFEVESQLPKAAGLVFWPTGDYWNIHRVRRLNVLANIIDDRLRKKIREELGDAYSPFAYSNPSKVYKDYGYMMALAMVDPDVAEKITQIILNIGEELSMERVSKDELERALNPMLSEVDRSERTNKYWLGVLEMAQEHPETLDWAKSRRSMYGHMTIDEVYEVAQSFLKADKALRVHVVPEINQIEVALERQKDSL